MDGRWVLTFSCFRSELAARRRDKVSGCGIWAAPIQTPTGPYDLSRAAPLTDESLYAGKVVNLREGGSVLLAFETGTAKGGFIGGICDPQPVAWEGDRLRIMRS